MELNERGKVVKATVSNKVESLITPAVPNSIQNQDYYHKRSGKQFFSHVGMEQPLPGYYHYFWGVNVPCSRTQHGLIRVGLEPPDLWIQSRRH